MEMNYFQSLKWVFLSTALWCRGVKKNGALGVLNRRKNGPVPEIPKQALESN